MEKHLTNKTINNKTIRFLMVGLLAFLVIGVNQVQAAPNAGKADREAYYKKCVKEDELFGIWNGYKGGKSGGDKVIFTKKQMTLVKEGSKPIRATYRRVNKNTIEATVNGKKERTKATVKDNVLTIINTITGSEIKYKRQTMSSDAMYLQCRMIGSWANDGVTTVISKDNKVKQYRSSNTRKLANSYSYRAIDKKNVEITWRDGSKETITVSFSSNGKTMDWDYQDGRTESFYKK